MLAPRAAATQAAAGSKDSVGLTALAADSFVGDIDTPPGEHFLNIAEAQREPEIQKTACRMTSGGNRCPVNEIGCMATPDLAASQLAAGARLARA
jgi:hypothetical protein